MTRNDYARIVLTIDLTAVAGCVDAMGYLRLRHFFVSFMSGDSTQLAVAATRGDWSHAGEAGAILALFVAGVIAGRLVSTALEDWGRPSVLSTEALLLVIAALLGAPTMVVTALTAAAMGFQNAAIDKEHAASLGLSYVTGTLVSFGDRLADALSGDRKHRWAWVPHFFHWWALALGAAGGTAAYMAWGMSALLIPAAAAAVLAGITAASKAHRHQKPRE